jgi:hypothetical protein
MLIMFILFWGSLHSVAVVCVPDISEERFCFHLLTQGERWVGRKERGVLLREAGNYLQNQDTPQDRYASCSTCCILNPRQIAGILLGQPDLKLNNQGTVSMVLAESTCFPQ